jgi:hypothetical protein
LAFLDFTLNSRTHSFRVSALTPLFVSRGVLVLKVQRYHFTFLLACFGRKQTFQNFLYLTESRIVLLYKARARMPSQAQNKYRKGIRTGLTDYKTKRVRKSNSFVSVIISWLNIKNDYRTLVEAEKLDLELNEDETMCDDGN